MDERRPHGQVNAFAPACRKFRDDHTDKCVLDAYMGTTMGRGEAEFDACMNAPLELFKCEQI
jgi:hypothetical protein